MVHVLQCTGRLQWNYIRVWSGKHGPVVHCHLTIMVITWQKQEVVVITGVCICHLFILSEKCEFIFVKFGKRRPW